jgi:hypothetical protein
MGPWGHGAMGPPMREWQRQSGAPGTIAIGCYHGAGVPVHGRDLSPWVVVAPGLALAGRHAGGLDLQHRRLSKGSRVAARQSGIPGQTVAEWQSGRVA